MKAYAYAVAHAAKLAVLQLGLGLVFDHLATPIRLS
jgi:hypothetical protein